MTPLFVAGLWRYPVKTLAGERLPAATLTADGVARRPPRAGVWP